MEDQLISYEIAKLAKDKGFDLKTKDSFYDLSGEFQIQYGSGKYHDDKLGKEWQEEKLACESEGYNRTVKAEYKRPTQSLLQCWLRDNHNICIYIEPTSLGDQAPFISDSWAKEIFNPWKNNNEGIDYSYEGALEWALKYSLNLIK